MKTIKTILVLFAFIPLYLSAQKLVEKDSMFYLQQGDNYFPAHRYKSAKMYRYLIQDHLSLLNKANLDSMFLFAKWNEEEQLRFKEIYSEQYRIAALEKKKFNKRSDKKLTASDSLIVKLYTIQLFYGVQSNSSELLRDSLTLSKTQIKEVLTCMETVPDDFIPDGNKCTRLYRHRLIFFDEEGKPCDSAKFCITCFHYDIASPISFGNPYRIVGNIRVFLTNIKMKFNEYSYVFKKGI